MAITDNKIKLLKEEYFLDFFQSVCNHDLYGGQKKSVEHVKEQKKSTHGGKVPSIQQTPVSVLHLSEAGIHTPSRCYKNYKRQQRLKDGTRLLINSGK